LKGGVGKTTTVIQLADCLSSQYGLKVLVVDLDPQTNSTISLIGEERWEALNDDNQTVAQIFLDSIENTKIFNPKKAIQKKVSSLGAISLHLLSSSLDLIDIQDRMSEVGGKYKNIGPTQPLGIALEDLYDDYDHILIDCPPNLGFITLNGLAISDYYLIPTIPDPLSTYGIPQIIRRVSDFKRSMGLEIRCMGTLITKYQSGMQLHDRTRAALPGRLRNVFSEVGEEFAPIFETYIPQSSATANAAQYFSPKTFKTKYGLTNSNGEKLYEYVISLTEEFLEKSSNE
jgi:chromosome partitioning protein